MKSQRISLCLLLLGALIASGADAWAASGGCAYAKTGAEIGGTGMGGTGARPESDMASKRVIAGNVVFSLGTVEARSEGRVRPLAKGAAVCEGETIVTAQSAKVQIRMADGGFIAMRPATKMKIDVFHFNGKEDGTEKSLFTLMEGGFRALTGMIGHTNKANYVIQTPTATIGIRGTDHEPMYIPEPAPGQAAAGAPGTYDKVNSGGVVIRTPQGEVEVKPNQVGFVPNQPSVPPIILREMPKFYRGESGGEGGFGPSERHGGSEGAGEPGGHAQRPEPGQGAEIHAPEPRTPEITAPEVRVPEMQAPETHGPED